MIDFSEVLGDSAGRKPIDPSKIFDLLPKQNSRYAYLRANQAAVLDQWLGVREKRDLIAKMNTGAGKTLLGILMLQSTLNEGIYPALYLCPDNYLARQVMAEANELEIRVVDDPADDLPGAPKVRVRQESSSSLRLRSGSPERRAQLSLRFGITHRCPWQPPKSFSTT
jgi:hypothetical protein